MLQIFGVTQTSFSFPLLLVISLVSLFIGYLIRSNAIRKYKNKVVSLENEMLKNHARILKLEKQLAEAKGEIKISRA